MPRPSRQLTVAPPVMGPACVAQQQRFAQQLSKQRIAKAAAAYRPHPELQPAYFADTVFSVLAELKRHRGLMSVAELAPVLGISEDALHRMCRKGTIPVFILPGCTVRRFDPASIAFWLSKHNPILNQVQKAS